jgi:hypothetical protein
LCAKHFLESALNLPVLPQSVLFTKEQKPLSFDVVFVPWQQVCECLIAYAAYRDLIALRLDFAFTTIFLLVAKA